MVANSVGFRTCLARLAWTVLVAKTPAPLLELAKIPGRIHPGGKFLARDIVPLLSSMQPKPSPPVSSRRASSVDRGLLEIYGLRQPKCSGRYRVGQCRIDLVILSVYTGQELEPSRLTPHVHFCSSDDHDVKNPEYGEENRGYPGATECLGNSRLVCEDRQVKTDPPLA